MRKAIAVAVFCAVILIGWAGAQSRPATNDSLPSTYVPAGNVLYKGYCATCHGIDATGQGPFALMLKVPPPNLTTLARRHGGKFPYAYVTNILRFGPAPTILHGSAAMPAWGPIFEYYDKNDERAVQQRIKNLTDYLASLQEE